MTNILEEKLNASGQKYEVLNFGRPGAETVDELALLPTVLSLAPDFVLPQWFVNDVEGHDKSRRPSGRRLVPSSISPGFFASTRHSII